MGPGIYFIHSAALPGVYLSPSVYMSLALIRMNTVCSYFYFYSYTNVTRRSTSIIKGECGVCECTCIEGLKEELAWAIGEQLWGISNLLVVILRN